MNIYTVIRKGELHPVFCEDFLISQNINDTYYLGAVLDGCSSGKDSHFASALFGKLLVKIANKLPYQVENLLGNSTQGLGKIILKQLFEEVIQARNHLMLDLLETLTTVLLLLYNKKEKEAFIIAIGDGFIAIDGNITEIDQDNRPDYLAYHVGKDFEKWYESQENIFFIKNPTDISISTDGADTFQTLRMNQFEEINPLDFLLLDNSFENQPNMLGRKCNILDKKYGFKPADDVGVLRIKF